MIIWRKAISRLPQIEAAVLWLGSATLVGTFGEGIFNLSAVVALLQQKGDAFQLGLLFTLMTLPSILLAPFQGVLMDRSSVKVQAIIGSLLRAAIVLGLAVAASCNVLSSSTLYIGILFYYVIWYFMIPLSETILARSVRDGHIGMVVLQGAWQVGALSSAFVAGLLLTVSNTPIVLASVGLLDLAAAYLYLQLTVDGDRSKAAQAPTPQRMDVRDYCRIFWNDIIEAAHYMVQVPNLSLLVGVAAMVHPLFQIINTLIGPMNNDVLGGTPLTLGWIESMAGLGSLLAALLSGLITSDRFNRAALIITELLLAATIMALPFARSLIFAAFLYIGIGVFTGTWKILSKSLLLRSMDVSFSGRIMTAVSFFGLIVGVATALISGWLGTLHLSLGYGVGFIIALSCGIVTAVGFWTAPFTRIKHRFVEFSMRIDS